jgi:hypothetical protein
MFIWVLQNLAASEVIFVTSFQEFSVKIKKTVMNLELSRIMKHTV